MTLDAKSKEFKATLDAISSAAREEALEEAARFLASLGEGDCASAVRGLKSRPTP